MILLIGGGLAATIYKQQNPELYGENTYSARMQSIREQYLAFVARANERAERISKSKTRTKQTQPTTPNFTFGDLISNKGGAFLVGMALIGMSGFRG